MRCAPPKSRSSDRVWYSSSDVVSTVRTALSAITFEATSRYRLSRLTSTVAPESCSRPDSSRSRFIGLIDTAIPPAFQVPSWAITNWGTFCRKMATRSPAANPASRMPAAKASVSSSSSRRVIRPSK
jgi:hypothetical protein